MEDKFDINIIETLKRSPRRLIQDTIYDYLKEGKLTNIESITFDYKNEPEETWWETAVEKMKDIRQILKILEFDEATYSTSGVTTGKIHNGTKDIIIKCTSVVKDNFQERTIGHALIVVFIDLDCSIKTYVGNVYDLANIIAHTIHVKHYEPEFATLD